MRWQKCRTGQGRSSPQDTEVLSLMRGLEIPPQGLTAVNEGGQVVINSLL